MTTQYTIVGTITGALWWPIGADAGKSVCTTFRRGPRGFDPKIRTDHDPLFHGNEADTLREAVESLMAREDGDFSSAAKFTADSYLVVRRTGRTHATERIFDLARFASIRGYITDELC